MNNRLYLQHLLILSTGLLVGIIASHAFMSIPFDYSQELEKAWQLGIVSRTTIDAYPKKHDIVNYLAVLGFPILFGVSGWIFWAKGKRRNDIAALFSPGTTSQNSTLGWKAVLAGVTVSYFTISFACFNSPAYDNAAALNTWYLLGEEGQHLAWAQSIMNGSVYGRDIHCFYGPLMIYPLVWLIKAYGASVATLRLYTYCLNLAAYAIVITFLYRTLRFKTTFAVSAGIYFWIFSPLTIFFPNASYLRVALGILPILLMYVYLENSKKWLLVATGLFLGCSILFSQEVGICSAISVGTIFLVFHLPEKNFRSLLHDAGYVLIGVAALLTPILGYFFANGALGDIFSSLTTQPRLQMLGLFALPFPDIRIFFGDFFNKTFLFCYAPIFIWILSALYLIPLTLLRHRDRNTLLRLSLLIFGILLFRSALGRSDVAHVSFVLPPAVLLVFLFTDDALSGLTKVGLPNKVVKAIAVGLSLSILGLFSQKNMYIEHLRSMRSGLALLGEKKMAIPYGNTESQSPRLGVPVSMETSEDIKGINNFLKSNTKPGDYVYFFPNEAAYYFIFNRNNPTKHANAFFVGTKEMRNELINDLERKRPTFVVYNSDPISIDGLSTMDYVPEIDIYIKTNYYTMDRHNNYLFMKRTGL